MKHPTRSWLRTAAFGPGAVLSLCLASLGLGAGTGSAQTLQQRLNVVSARMKQLRDLSARLDESTKGKLSSGAQHLLRMATTWDQIEPVLARSAGSLNAPLLGRSLHPSGALGQGAVSDPGTDLSFSRMGGFTQSETSTAWCGSHVLVAYNDSGSFLETFPIPGIGQSFNGYSLSTDGGRSFTDLGFLNPGQDLSNSLGGDPVAVCTDENTFYQSSIFQFLFSTGVSVSKSTDGGRTFADPVVPVLKDGATHFIDKPWMATDPSNPARLYVTYTDVDSTGFFGGPALCPGTLRLGIELVRSTDGGATWSAPTVVDNGCFPNRDQGSNVAVDRAGNVYVAWEQLPAFSPTNEIDIAKSTDGGATFAPKSTVATVTIVGSNFFGLLQGGFRNNEFPSLAIDLSHGGTSPLYISWNDGRFGVTPDGFPPFFSGVTYNFGDALVSRSDDGGKSWSSPVKVNSDTSPADHFLPGVAVDPNGTVGVCFYDRHRDPTNFFIDRECARSNDGGQTWTSHRVTKRSFAPSIAGDLLINSVYMGDYDGLAADTTGGSRGFLGAYGDNSRGNPDVKISKRFGTEDSDDGDDN
ncbi:MAG TPA: hypothetical protein VN461_17040 [Vicinamibacteria bacterium]|nr:hypothetical protein [Vicinamibacteria bacterium]